MSLLRRAVAALLLAAARRVAGRQAEERPDDSWIPPPGTRDAGDVGITPAAQGMIDRGQERDPRPPTREEAPLLGSLEARRAARRAG